MHLFKNISVGIKMITRSLFFLFALELDRYVLIPAHSAMRQVTQMSMTCKLTCLLIGLDISCMTCALSRILRCTANGRRGHSRHTHARFRLRTRFFSTHRSSVSTIEMYRCRNLHKSHICQAVYDKMGPLRNERFKVIINLI